eukprot:g15319.t1
MRGSSAVSSAAAAQGRLQHRIEDWIAEDPRRRNQWRAWKDEVCAGSHGSTSIFSESPLRYNANFGILLQPPKCSCPFGTKLPFDVSWTDYSKSAIGPCSRHPTEAACSSESRAAVQAQQAGAAGQARDEGEGGGASAAVPLYACEWMPFVPRTENNIVNEVWAPYGTCVTVTPTSTGEQADDLNMIDGAPHLVVQSLCALSGYVPVLVAGLIFLRFLLRRTTTHLFNFGFLIAVVLVNECGIKKLFREARPPESCAGNYGMPSGHSAVAVGLLTLKLLELVYRTQVNAQRHRNEIRIVVLDDHDVEKEMEKPPLDCEDDHDAEELRQPLLTSTASTAAGATAPTTQEPCTASAAGAKQEMETSSPSASGGRESSSDEASSAPSPTGCVEGGGQKEQETGPGRSHDTDQAEGPLRQAGEQGKDEQQVMILQRDTKLYNKQVPSSHLRRSLHDFHFFGVQLARAVVGFFDCSSAALEDPAASHGETALWVAIWVFLLVPVGPCRNVLRDHTPTQILVGLSMGFLVGVLWFRLGRCVAKRTAHRLGTNFAWVLTHDLATPFHEFQIQLRSNVFPALRNTSARTSGTQNRRKGNADVSEQGPSVALEEGARRQLAWYLAQRRASLRLALRGNGATTNACESAMQIEDCAALDAVVHPKPDDGKTPAIVQSAGRCTSSAGDWEVRARAAKVREVLRLQQELEAITSAAAARGQENEETLEENTNSANNEKTTKSERTSVGGKDEEVAEAKGAAV